LDACYSGIALSPIARRGRCDAGAHAASGERSRRSRMIITSARDDQRALDRGPRPGHSLLTGCLIDAMTGAMAIACDAGGRGTTTATELACHLRRRVPSAGGASWQTPDFGTFELDEGGEMELPVLAARPAGLAPRAATVGRAPRRRTLRQFGEASSLIRLSDAPLPSASSSGRAAAVSMRRVAVTPDQDPALHRIAMLFFV